MSLSNGDSLQGVDMTDGVSGNVCPCYEEGCDFEGKNERALAMHTLRVHSDDPRWKHGFQEGSLIAKANRARARKREEQREAEAAADDMPAEPAEPEPAEPAAVPAGEPTAKKYSRNIGPPEPCPVCGKIITTTYMRNHLRVVHKAEIPAKRRTVMPPRLDRQVSRTITGPDTRVSSTHRIGGFVRNPEYVRPDEMEPVTAGPNITPSITPARGGQISDDDWEERAATVRRASAEFVRLTAERADMQLNLSALTVADDVVLLRDGDGRLWMLKRVD